MSEKILFVAPRMIGDAVMASGALDRLVAARPGARVTVAASPEAAALFTHMPGLHRLIAVRKRQDHAHWLKLWAEVVRTRWDLAVDLKGSGLPYAVLARQRFMRRPMPGLRLFEQHAALLGLDPAPLPVVWTGAAERARAAALLGDGAPVVALCPTASWTPKMWPAERFAALFRRLASGALPGARAAVFGGPGAREREGAAPLLRALPDAVDLVGALSLPEVSACLARCALAVSNDSGLMHIAAAAGIPTLGLRAHFPDQAARVEPAGRAAGWVLRAGDDMAAIAVEDAEEGSRRVLELAASGLQ
ncbi:glycosyltransferase family 9 protein [Lichenibacterium dinghuense]|uniref:glycosyltransferase family 9 protein n=1 Tax=Lichenibacterium dinghuense TaxID=2895977 RepID=UPI001F3DEA65|nr:glycosyltransferase family 9 protein [Lichenibacterium sp. 6Y81]